MVAVPEAQEYVAMWCDAMRYDDTSFQNPLIKDAFESWFWMHVNPSVVNKFKKLQW